MSVESKPKGNHTPPLQKNDVDQISLDSFPAVCSNTEKSLLMTQIPKTELSPDNGCIIDTKWKLGPLSYHASAAGKVAVPLVTEVIRLPELVVYDHIGFKGAYARTNLSFHYIGDFWNDRISCLIVVSGVWRFYRDEYYKGDYWDLGPGFYESFFAKKGPDDVVSSFQAIALT